ncbi:plus-3-domain-containing protein [Mycena amicta]|nr:plus-3-domain-containing protein [Mycena amicta]
MSSELDDELLELVAGTSDKERAPTSRKRARDSGGKTANKKRRTADSDAEPESEEDDSARPHANGRNGRIGKPASRDQVEQPDDDKYPLEGKYVDEADREELLSKTEIEREEILAARLDEVERIRDRKHLEKLSQQQLAGVVGTTNSDDGGPARRTARTVGKDKDRTKDRSINALKAKRKARDEKKRNPSSPRARSGSPDDMEMSMSEDDGADDADDARRDKPERDKLDEPMSIEAMRRITISRDDLAKHSSSPFFEQIVVGCWVRYCIGAQNNQSVYRACQIRKLVPGVKSYVIERHGRLPITMKYAFELKHGAAEKVWPMDRASNVELTPDEYNRAVGTYASEKIGFPTMREATERHMEMQKYVTKLATEEDVNNMLTRKRGNAPTTNSLVSERARLTAARKLAMNRHDNGEVAQIDEQLRVLNESTSGTAAREVQEDVLAKVNERNRKANMESVRKAEIEAAERKRKDRKAATPTPKTFDPSARLRTVPRLFESTTPGGTRPTTPNPTPPSVAITPAVHTNGVKKSLDAVAKAMEVDLGDF